MIAAASIAALFSSRWERTVIMDVGRGTRKTMVVCAGLALAAALAFMAGGCGKPGEGTVHVDSKVAAKLGKPRGLAPRDYGKSKVAPIGNKSRPRNDAAPK
jgi:hypothetical protein